MDTTRPERSTLANTLWEFVKTLRFPTIISGAEKFLYLPNLIGENGRLSIIPLKLAPLTWNKASFQGQCSSESNENGHGV